MSRAVEHLPWTLARQNAVKELIDKGRGSLSKKAFSERTGVSLSIISKVSNCSLSSTPTPDIFYRLALITRENDVDYQSLCLAAGYDLNNNVVVSYMDSAREHWNIFFDNLMESFEAKGISFKHAKIKGNGDFVFELDDDFSWILEFDQEYVHRAESVTTRAMASRRVNDALAFWGNVATYDLEDGWKYSIVTDSQAKFDAYCNLAPKMFHVACSVILIDGEGTFKKETYLQTRFELSEDQKKELSYLK